MALDATILRKDGRELGRREDVARALGEVFVGATFGWVPSGAEKLKISRQRGVEFPPELAKHFMAQPATFEGNWSGPDYSVQFYFSDRELIERLEIALTSAY